MQSGTRRSPTVAGYTRSTLIAMALCIAVCGPRGQVTAQVANAADSLVLVEFYGATDGDNWANSRGWLSSRVRSWRGIELNSDGRVVRIVLLGNRLSGQIPPELAELAYLEELDLRHNALNGPIPTVLADLTQLRQLKLGTNELSGAIPTELGDLQGLTWLSLDHNQLTGTIPLELTSLSSLKELWLSGNQLEGEIPPELAELDSLNGLVLSANRLSGMIPVELARLNNLESLWLDRNELSGSIPPALGQMAQLRSLRLGSNLLSGPIPKELGDLSNLNSLYLADNALSGGIPTELAQLNQLKWLGLSSNQLSGPVPEELGDLLNLQSLNLEDNALSGEIPSELAQLTQLKWLTLDSNRLGGRIPPELGNLTALEELRLNDNTFTGSIPAGLAKARRLKWFFVQNNYFSGLPDLTESPYLDSIDVSNNRMSFEDLEPNGELTSGFRRPWFAYVPQDSINTRLWRTLTHIVFTVTTGGEQNRYQWFRDGQPIVGANAAQLRISKDAPASAVYHAEVTHPLLRDLTLTSRPLSSDAMPTQAEEEASSLPQISLHANYPNPFTRTTQIPFNLDKAVHVRITVHDMLGRLMRTLTDTELPSGQHRVSFDARDIAPGMYYYRLQAGHFQDARSLTVLR